MSADANNPPPEGRQHTCDDCYFRRSAICAMRLDTPCPTFRLFTRGSFAPLPQPRRLPALGELVAQYAAAS